MGLSNKRGFTKLMFWKISDHPLLHVVKDLDQDLKEKAVKALRSGKTDSHYMGFANCRICRKQLGTKDMMFDKFMWPEKADHYVEVHNVWVPELDDLIKAME